MTRSSGSALATWIEFAIVLVAGFFISLAVATGVSLLLSGQVPWLTDGWQHEVAKYVGLALFLVILAIFSLREARRKN